MSLSLGHGCGGKLGGGWDNARNREWSGTRRTRNFRAAHLGFRLEALTATWTGKFHVSQRASKSFRLNFGFGGQFGLARFDAFGRHNPQDAITGEALRNGF